MVSEVPVASDGRRYLLDCVRSSLHDHARQLAEGCIIRCGSAYLVDSISAAPHHADPDVKVNLSLVSGTREP